MNRRLVLLLFALACTTCAAPPAAARPDPLGRARLLHRSAEESLDDVSAERRARAVEQVEEAIRLDPDGVAGDHWRLLGWIHELCSRDRMAGDAYRHAAAQRPGAIDAWLGLGRVGRRQFLRSLDREALRDAIAALDSACACRPPSSLPWLALVTLRYEDGDLEGARDAAERALRLYPRMPESELATAAMAWRTGDVERSDSLFRAVIPKLPADTRLLFDHPGRYVGSLAASVRPETTATGEVLPPRSVKLAGKLLPGPVAARRPFAEIRPEPAVSPDVLPDADPTTPQNETLLEYWSRAAHAVLLFDDPIRPGLDMRAQVYLRYGPPAQVQYNPAGVPLFWTPLRTRVTPQSDPRAMSTLDFPLHAQLWVYPDLGMQFLLHDRSLQGRWTAPWERGPSPGSLPNPSALARRQDLLALQGGWAVFPTLPPRAQRLDVVTTLAGFETADGPRLAAFVQADADSLEARWVVNDARGRPIASGSQAMRRSLCASGARVTAEFDVGLPPGRYEVVTSARDHHGRRGLSRGWIELEKPMGVLALSDVVLCCGEPALLVDRGAIRLDPVPGAVVRGDAPLTAYAEMYRFATGDDGLSHYTFDYRIERMGFDAATKRRVPSGTYDTWASREETFRGEVRRQFIRVPVAALPPGEYRFVLTVHDVLGGTSEVRTAEFRRP